ncbi:substrate-binding periplasmic protein [Chitinimonas naiadis]
MLIDSSHRVSGVIADFLDRVSAESGCRFDYLIMPRVRSFPEMRQGKVDVVASAIRTSERDQLGQFLPTLRAPIVLITLSNRVPASMALPLLAQGKLMINVVRGHDYGPAYQQLLQTLRSQGRLEEVDSPETVAKKLAVGRADGTITLGVVMADVAPQQGLGDKLQLQPIETIPAVVSGFYLSNSRLSDTDRWWLASALKAGIRDGEFWRLYRKRYPTWALQGVVAQGLGN